MASERLSLGDEKFLIIRKWAVLFSSIFESPLQVVELKLNLGLEELTARLQEVPHAFLLESSMDVAGMGQWSFLGGHSISSFVSHGDRWQVNSHIHPEAQNGAPSAAWEALEQWWQAWGERQQRWPQALEHEPPFLGGAVGYLGYEFGEGLELADTRASDAEIPDSHFELYDEFLAFHHSSGKCYACHYGRSGYQQRQWWLQPARCEPAKCEPALNGKGSAEYSTNLSDERYLLGVEEIRQRIFRGEIYELNYCRQHRSPVRHDFWLLYQRLRRRQPVPYGAALNWQPVSIACASPERFLRRRGDWVDTRPIKGTASRSGSAEENQRSAQALLASEKERAELAMIIDLSRNDLGRVCIPGTVEVVEDYALEEYATVFHTVATVKGQYALGRNPWPLIRACFPAGSITGAPKIAAMKATLELEPTARRAYTGSIGWIAANGDLDLNIAIRIVWRFKGYDHTSLGGAITWDSDPQLELEELSHKGRALFSALE